MINFRLVAMLFIFILLAAVINTCAGKVDGVASCPVDCGNSINANSDTIIVPVSGGVTINCVGNETPNVVEVLFSVKSPSGVGSTSESPAIPRGSIAVRPVYTGTYDSSKVTKNTEPEFKGIETPKSMWCSNKCGIAKIKLWPECRDGASLTHSLKVISGPVSSAEVSITATNPEKEDSGE